MSSLLVKIIKQLSTLFRKSQFFAFVPTLVGGAASIAHIIDEATAKRDMENYGQYSLDVVINN